MPRYPRSFVVGYAHHIVQRGHDRKPIFAIADDYRFYLENLAEQKALLDIRIFAYCLMTNHVHLVAQPERQGSDLSRLMRVLAARHTRYSNRLERRTGTLWEGRFKSSLIDTDQYLLACCRYVDLNPVRAGMVAVPEAYPWSSYNARAGNCQAAEWLDFDPPYTGLGRVAAERQVRYRDFVAEGVSASELRLIRQAVQRNQLTGSDRFAELIASKVGRRIEARGPGRPRKEK
jgi:putative transposase